MFQIRFEISQVEFGIWSHFGHGYPKSKIQIWEVPNRNADLGMSQIRFGTKSRLVYNIQSELDITIFDITIFTLNRFLALYLNI